MMNIACCKVRKWKFYGDRKCKQTVGLAPFSNSEIYYILCLQFVFTFWVAYPTMWLIARFIGFLSLKKLGRIHSKNLPKFKGGCMICQRGRGLIIYPRVSNNVDLFLQKNCDCLVCPNSKIACIPRFYTNIVKTSFARVQNRQPYYD